MPALWCGVVGGDGGSTGAVCCEGTLLPHACLSHTQARTQMISPPPALLTGVPHAAGSGDCLGRGAGPCVPAQQVGRLKSPASVSHALVVYALHAVAAAASIFLVVWCGSGILCGLRFGETVGPRCVFPPFTPPPARQEAQPHHPPRPQARQPHAQRQPVPGSGNNHLRHGWVCRPPHSFFLSLSLLAFNPSPPSTPHPPTPPQAPSSWRTLGCANAPHPWPSTPLSPPATPPLYSGTVKLADFGLSKTLPVNRHAEYGYLDSKFRMTGETGGCVGEVLPFSTVTSSCQQMSQFRGF